MTEQDQNDMLTYDDPIDLTFGKLKLQTFLSKLSNLMVLAITNTTEQEPWLNTWETWTGKRILTCKTRRQLATIVLGNRYNSKSTVAATLAQIIETIKTTIPCVNDLVKFDKSPSDPAKWIISFATKQSQLKYFGVYEKGDNNDENKEEKNFNNDKEGQAWNEVVKAGSAKITRVKDENNNEEKETDTKQQSNPYDILGEDNADDDNDDDELNQETTTDDDNMISYDTTDENTITADAPSPSNRSDNQDSEQDFTDNVDDIIPVLTEEELIRVTEIVKNDAIDEENMPLVIKWILST
jgi:hypothetical protein